MKKFLINAVDVLGGGLIYLVGVILGLCGVVGGAIVVAFAFLMSFAMPVLCIVAAWGILRYLGVL